MGRLIGVVCDACGKLDIEISAGESSYLMEDMFPRNNWMSISQWVDEGVPDPIDIHICSPECLYNFSKTFLESPNQEHEHSHD